jgi:hypothetical protein
VTNLRRLRSTPPSGISTQVSQQMLSDCTTQCMVLMRLPVVDKSVGANLSLFELSKYWRAMRIARSPGGNAAFRDLQPHFRQVMMWKE